LRQRAVSVTFILDYLVLAFDAYRMTLFEWPVIILPTGRLQFGEPEYRDSLCSIIATNVIDASEVFDDYIEMKFDCEIALRISVGFERRHPDVGMLVTVAPPYDEVMAW
jgi:hypothetical protein